MEVESTKYEIYVEEYVLAYLRRETGSLELSEIYFYGRRESGGRKLFVYGAGRGRGIDAFAAYAPLEELLCRLTQAGPVFMVCGGDGKYKAAGFQVFYENNEAMQSYLIEWTGRAEKGKDAEKSGAKKEEYSLPDSFPEEKKRQTTHGAMSVQLGLILVVLVAIVITSADSYDKLEQLNQSAREVFFAIENQEADVTVEGNDEPEELVVERDVAAARERERGEETDGKTEEPSTGQEAADMSLRTEEGVDGRKGAAGTQDEEASRAEEGVDGRKGTADTQSEEAMRTEEGVGEPKGNAGKQDESVAEGQRGREEEGGAGETEESLTGQEEPQDKQDAAAEEEEGGENTSSDEENEEALSRSITRYYEVEQGDTLYTISQKIYGDISRVGKICEMNQITDPDRIRSGQRIILP